MIDTTRIAERIQDEIDDALLGISLGEALEVVELLQADLESRADALREDIDNAADDE